MLQRQPTHLEICSEHFQVRHCRSLDEETIKGVSIINEMFNILKSLEGSGRNER